MEELLDRKQVAQRLRLGEDEQIRKVQAGSRDDFRPLVLCYQSRIYSAIVRMGVAEQTAKDLTQEVFLKAYLNICSFRFEASFQTWLLRIAINHTKNHFTSKGFRQDRNTVEFEAARETEMAAREQFDTFDRESLSELQACVQRLPEALREVLILCGFEQRAYQEVAELLQIPIGTVRSRLHAARMQVKQLYFRNHGER